MPETSDRVSERVASNKSSHMAVQILEDDVEVFECDNSFNQGKKCHLALKNKGNVVAYGTIVSDGGPNVMLHNAPLGEGNLKVSVDVVLQEEAELPIPLKSGPTVMVDAVGTVVGWPKELVIFPTTKKKEKPAPPFAILEVPDEKNKFKEVESALPMPCKFLYSFVVRLMTEEETIPIEFDEAMFGRNLLVQVLEGNKQG
ncbi:uncharacterized protein LOC122022917 [Zingiber officinale]|uniref:uncharacterized protein LOC122022917 n=1 Tax=Zingiber officinale TaxID=94328 RepID=UPI001C4C21BD|nr:uncharacterized protein LOC122022917 [Zingiber officinale]